MVEGKAVKDISQDEIDAWLIHQRQVKEVFFPALNKIVKARQDVQKDKFNKTHNVNVSLPDLTPGAVVYVYDQLRKSKNQPPFMGPYTVKAFKDGRYSIADSVGGLYHRQVVRQELKVPKDAVHSGDKNHYYVECILNHKTDAVNDSFLYEVQWVGLDKSYNSWLEAKYIEPNLISSYLATLKRLPSRNSVKAQRKLVIAKTNVAEKSRRKKRKASSMDVATEILPKKAKLNNKGKVARQNRADKRSQQ
jgi:hypothetical protein